MYNEMYMGMYAVLNVYTAGCPNRSEIVSNRLEFIGLNAYAARKRCQSTNLAKRGRILAVLNPNLALTSPSNCQNSRALLCLERLAMLEGSYAYIRARDVRHLYVMYVYKKRIQSNTKLTSQNLLTSPTSFLGCVQHLSPIFRSAAVRTTLPRRTSLASILRGVRTLNATRQNRISCVLPHPAVLVVEMSKLAVFVGPPPRKRLSVARWTCVLVEHSLFRWSIIQGINNV